MGKKLQKPYPTDYNLLMVQVQAGLLINLINNLAERIHKVKYKYEHDNKACETCGIRYKDGESCLE